MFRAVNFLLTWYTLEGEELCSRGAAHYSHLEIVPWEECVVAAVSMKSALGNAAACDVG